jgi:FMN phosphatase YigB (HAD superfamily)
VTQFRAVLFDAGDTLIRLSGRGADVLHRAAARLGAGTLDPAEADKVWQTVLHRASTPEELAKGRDLSLGRHREIWTELYAAAGCEDLAPGLSEELYTQTVNPSSWEAFPDTVPTLEAIRRANVRIGVLSDTGFDLRPVLDALSITPWIDVLQMSFEFGVCKPDATTFRSACEQLGANPAETLMVGDNPLTDGGAVTAGLAVYLLPPPQTTALSPRGLSAVVPLLTSAGQPAGGLFD